MSSMLTCKRIYRSAVRLARAIIYTDNFHFAKSLHLSLSHRLGKYEIVWLRVILLSIMLNLPT